MGDIGLVKTEYLSLTEGGQPFLVESGHSFQDLIVAFETYGKLNHAGDNCILVIHALTGSAHAAGRHSPDDRLPGWWDPLIGPGRTLDTDKYFLICPNVLGSCYGTTGPASLNPDTGKPFGMSFPVFNIRDMVHLQKRLLDKLGVKRLITAVGGSMGGMQVLEWLINYPEFLHSGITIAAAGRLSAQTIAYNQMQRKAICLDPAWSQGDYHNSPGPQKGLALARMIATITYKGNNSFDQRFGRAFSGLTTDDYYRLDSTFEVENYLQYQGDKLVKRFDANCYLYLTKAMDLHDIGFPFNAYKEAFARIKAPVLAVGVNSDILYPVDQQKEIVELVQLHGGTAFYQEISSPHGHDGFLIEFEQLGQIITDFLVRLP